MAKYWTNNLAIWSHCQLPMVHLHRKLARSITCKVFLLVWNATAYCISAVRCEHWFMGDLSGFWKRNPCLYEFSFHLKVVAQLLSRVSRHRDRTKDENERSLRMSCRVIVTFRWKKLQEIEKCHAISNDYLPYLLAYLPTYLPACLPTYLPTYLPTNLPTYLLSYLVRLATRNQPGHGL